MKIGLTTILLSVLATVASGSASLSPIMVSFPDDTPVSIIDQAKAAIKDAGGIITHEFQTIKAFSAKAPTTAVDAVKAMDAKYGASVEYDQVASIAGT